MQQLDQISSYKIKDTEGIKPSDTIYSGYLIGGIVQTVTIPTGAEFVLFSYEGNVFANYDNTASIPSGTISLGGGELNPKIRYIGENTTISLISERSTRISLSFFKK